MKVISDLRNGIKKPEKNQGFNPLEALIFFFSGFFIPIA